MEVPSKEREARGARGVSPARRRAQELRFCLDGEEGQSVRTEIADHLLKELTLFETGKVQTNGDFGGKQIRGGW